MKGTFQILTIGFALAVTAVQSAPGWEIKSTADGWQMLRNGEPFYIRGAVAPNRFDVLRACGANAIRVNASQKALDAAQEAGLVVMAKLPVRGERNKLDWDNAAQVDEQKAKVLAVVRELKDHPTLMFWSVGNELDHIPGNKPYNPKIWERLNGSYMELGSLYGLAYISSLAPQHRCTELMLHRL